MEAVMLGKLNDKVRAFWDEKPCGTHRAVTGDTEVGNLAWFERIAEHRYSVEPYIHSFAQFTRHHGKTILEIGVGAGTDHLQWKRAGAECYGVDLSGAAVEMTMRHLAAYGFESNLNRIDAESLPFETASFDLVYSWGVIHHSERPELIIDEILRVLKPRGVFIGMMYHRRSLRAFEAWVKHALLAGKPWRSCTEVIWNHVESIGTKAYTVSELEHLFSGFGSFSAAPVLTVYDMRPWPRWWKYFLSDKWGWFITIRATK
jgi:SAM-dependent methyltransferase